MTIRRYVHWSIRLAPLIMLWCVCGSRVMAQSSEPAPGVPVQWPIEPLLLEIEQPQPVDVSALNTRVEQLEKFVASITRLTWNDYGCVPDDPTFDNGPVLTRMLAAQGDTILVPPVGTMRVYYVSTPIEWPKRTGGALLGSGGLSIQLPDPQYTLHKQGGGVTRIIWNGEPGRTMLDYVGCGGRIENLIFQGQPVQNNDTPLDRMASVGILVETGTTPPTGELVCRNVGFFCLDRGLACVGEGGHADTITMYSPLWAHVRIPYQTDADQSTVHQLYAARVLSGYEIAFDCRRGGDLAVFGLYVGASRDATLLRVGTSGANAGCFEIYGLKVDGSAKNLRLVEHGQFVHRVRIQGHVGSSATLAKPMVLAREPSPTKDIQIDCFNAQWPATAQ